VPPVYLGCLAAVALQVHIFIYRCAILPVRLWRPMLLGVAVRRAMWLIVSLVLDWSVLVAYLGNF
jgi:hypothetical protein